MIDGDDRPIVRSQQAGRYDRRAVGGSQVQPTNLADLLERVLDKGVVIAGDITLLIGNVEFLTLKIRLLVASVDKAQEIGINWWQSDPSLSGRARELEAERDQLKERVERLEARLAAQLGEPREQQPEEAQGAQEAPPEAQAAEARPEAEETGRRRRGRRQP